MKSGAQVPRLDNVLDAGVEPRDGERADSSTGVERRRPLSAATRELVLIAVLYVGYTSSRTLASNNFQEAVESAHRIQVVQGFLDLNWESAINAFFTHHLVVAVAASFWYAVAHYLFTLGTFIYVWGRHRDHYSPARTALVLATVTALGLYLLMPTAPPRLMPGFVDTLAQTSSYGWWSAHASAPKGLGHVTNELAAMPSLHVGWAVWVSLTLGRIWCRPWQRALLWAYPVVTTVVVIGTANHWVLDAIAGAALVVAADYLVQHRGWLQPHRASNHQQHEAVPAVVSISGAAHHEQTTEAHRVPPQRGTHPG